MSEKVEAQSGIEPRWLLISFITAGCVLIVFGGIAFFQYRAVQSFIELKNSDDFSAFGLSGDFFGLANSVFSALAFAMIIVTLWMQKYELKQQREELEITRDVLKQQQLEMEEQNESLRRQTFENTFFGMLQMHSEIVAAVKAPGNQATGREAFGSLISILKNDSQTQSQQGSTTVKREGISVQSYETWYHNHESEVGHYFRTLYNMMRYINENGGDQRATYARLVRAQLSSNELQLLLYNGLCKYGKDKFKPLIEKYALLKHLRQSPELQTWRDQYNQSAFGVNSEGAV